MLGLVLGGFWIVVLAMLFPRDLPTTAPATPLTEGPAVASADDTAEVPDAPTTMAEGDAGPQSTTAPSVQATSSTGVIALAETEPAALPDVEMAAPEPDLPPEPQVADVAAEDESPVFPNPQSRAPATPLAERDIVVSTEPATPAAPVIVEDDLPQDATIEVVVVEADEAVTANPAQTNETAVEDVAMEAPAATEEAGSVPDDESAPAVGDSVPALADVEVAAVAPDVTDAANAPSALAQPEVSEDVSVAQSNVDDAVATVQSDLVLSDVPTEIALADDITQQPEPPSATEEANDLTGTDETQAPDVVASTDEPAVLEEPQELNVPDADVAELPTASGEVSETPSEAPVVVSLLNRDTTAAALPTGNSGIRINRIRSTETVVEEATPAEVEPEQPTAALEAYAVTFENPQSLPLIAVTLIDNGAISDAATALADVNLPVTIVLDSAKSDANARMTSYRAAGLEVAGTVALPDGATASDAAIALEAGRLNLPEAIAYVDVAGVAQNNRELVAQFALTAAEMGQGLVIGGQSLNSGLGGAQALGVPVGEIYRDLAVAQQDARVLERFLAQAAFQARQEDAVVLVGELNVETLDALRNFLDTPRGKQIALAPLSAVLALQ